MTLKSAPVSTMKWAGHPSTVPVMNHGSCGLPRGLLLCLPFPSLRCIVNVQTNKQLHNDQSFHNYRPFSQRWTVSLRVLLWAVEPLAYVVPCRLSNRQLAHFPQCFSMALTSLLASKHVGRGTLLGFLVQLFVLWLDDLGIPCILCGALKCELGIQLQLLSKSQD